MLQILKRFFWLLLLSLAAERASAFSMWGPAESWQTTDLDYGNRLLLYNTTELGGTKNFGVGSRMNVPIVTYSFDYSFLSYFGTKGVAAVDSAMKVLNALPTASNAKLAKFITQGIQQVNYSAEAMSLLDIKSATLNIMMEHFGLIGETHVFDLRTRQAVAGTCNFNYYVLTRNYDPVTYEPTPYVNGMLYTYQIEDLCPIGDSVADAIEIPADQNIPQSTYTALATQEGLLIGGYYTGLSRDDMGGLKYLYRRSNYNNEVLDPNSVVNGGFSSGFQIVNTSITNTPGSNIAGIFGGVEKIQFVKVYYQSLLSTDFTPITYHYTVPFVTNGTVRNLQVARTILRPDIVFSAADLVNTGANPAADNTYTRNVIWTQDGVATPADPALAGGLVENSVISPQQNIVFNTAGGIYYNTTPSFLDQRTAVSYPIFIWGSFDGSTSTPVIFPDGASIVELEQQVLSGGSSLPEGTWNPFSNTNLTTSTTAGTIQ